MVVLSSMKINAQHVDEMEMLSYCVAYCMLHQMVLLP
jgi:hypothetical protein